jgi:hypothetical protein
LASKFWLFVEELKRRKVLPFAVVYAVIGVGTIEASRIVFAALGLPPIIWQVTAIIILLGFPLVLVMGQVLEVSPEEPLPQPSADRGSIKWILPAMGLLVALLAMYVLVFRRG